MLEPEHQYVGALVPELRLPPKAPGESFVMRAQRRHLRDHRTRTPARFVGSASPDWVGTSVSLRPARWGLRLPRRLGRLIDRDLKSPSKSYSARPQRICPLLRFRFDGYRAPVHEGNVTPQFTFREIDRRSELLSRPTTEDVLLLVTVRAPSGDRRTDDFVCPGVVVVVPPFLEAPLFRSAILGW